MLIVECTREYWEFVRKLRMDGRVIDGFLKTTPITEEQQIKYMTNNSQHYRIALLDGKPAGYVGVIEDDIRVCTHPDFFGMGVGKFMIKLKLLDNGLKRITSKIMYSYFQLLHLPIWRYMNYSEIFPIIPILILERVLRQ